MLPSLIGGFCRGRRLQIVCIVAFVLLFSPAIQASPGIKSQAYFDKNIHPLLKQYCYPCHSSEKHKGDFDMERFTSVEDVKQHTKIWRDVSEKLAGNEMPPEEKPQPSPVEKQRIAGWINALL